MSGLPEKFADRKLTPHVKELAFKVFSADVKSLEGGIAKLKAINAEMPNAFRRCFEAIDTVRESTGEFFGSSDDEIAAQILKRIKVQEQIRKSNNNENNENNETTEIPKKA